MTPAVDMGELRTAVATRDDLTRNVLVLYEPGRCGEAALAEGAALVASSAAMLTVVTLAPQDTKPGCTVYADAYNAGVRDQAAAELAEAGRLLSALGTHARYERLVEGRDLPLGEWVARGAFDLVLLPAHRAPFARRRSATRRLTRSRPCEVRICTAPR